MILIESPSIKRSTFPTSELFSLSFGYLDFQAYSNVLKLRQPSALRIQHFNSNSSTPAFRQSSALRVQPLDYHHFANFDNFDTSKRSAFRQPRASSLIIFQPHHIQLECTSALINLSIISTKLDCRTAFNVRNHPPTLHHNLIFRRQPPTKWHPT